MSAETTAMSGRETAMSATEATSNRLTQGLTLLLALQLLIAAALFWPRENSEERDARAALLNIEQAVTAIDISDGDNAVRLLEDNGNWTLADYPGLPVDASRLDPLLNDLPNRGRGWPLASSASALQRFEVAQDTYQRRIRYLNGDEKVGELYLGSSPGFRKVHIRPGDDDQVYSTTFSAFDVPTTANAWLDKKLLRVSSEMQSIAGSDYTLRRGDDGRWQNAAGQTANEPELSRLLGAIRNLRVAGIADPAIQEMLAGLDFSPTLEIGTESGALALTLYEIDEAYYIARDDFSGFFDISASDYDRLTGASSATLFPGTTAEPAVKSDQTGP